MEGFMSLIHAFLESWYVVVWLAVMAAMGATLLAAVVLAINAAGRRWLSARQMSWLWALVLIRLLVPLAPENSLSFQGLVYWMATETETGSAIAAQAAASLDVEADAPTTAETLATAASTLPLSSANASAEFDFWDFIDKYFPAMSYCWLIGAVASLLWTGIVQWQFGRRLKQATPCTDQRLSTLWQSCCRQTGVRRNIPIVQFDGIGQPAVCGLLYPKLLLPPDIAELDDAQLRMVMLHELAHIKRRDVACNYLLVAIRAVHWWNPVYWLAASRYLSLREQACDAFAIRHSEGTPARDYSQLLLSLTERSQAGTHWQVRLPMSLLGSMSSYFRKWAIRNRLSALRSAGVVRGRWHTAAVASMILCLAFCGLTDARLPVPPDEEYPAEMFPSNDNIWQNWSAPLPEDHSPSVTRSYNVAKVLQRIGQDEWSSDSRLQLHYQLIYLMQCNSSQFKNLSNVQLEAFFSVEGNVLTMSAPEKVHSELETNIAAWEQSGLGQISIETRILSAKHDIASAAGISWQSLEAFSADYQEPYTAAPSTDGTPIVRAQTIVDEFVPVVSARLDATQVTKLLQTAYSDRSATNIVAPKVTVFNGQRASIVDSSQQPFVVGIQHVGGAEQPKLAVVETGIKTTTRAIQGEHVSQIQLESQIELSGIVQISEASALLNGKLQSFQIPSVKRQRINVSAVIEDGHALLVGCIPRTFDKRGYFYLLLTPRNVVPSQEQAK